MELALRSFFEEQVQFCLQNGTAIEGGVFIGSTEINPVKILSDDPPAYREEFAQWLTDIWKPEQKQRRDEILSLYGNMKRYDDLTRAIGRKQVVPFIGSGMSVASGLPMWSDLLRRAGAFTSSDLGKLERLLQLHRFEEAADLVASESNPRLLAERVEHELRINGPTEIGGAVRLLPALFPNLVITTNLDAVLEDLYSFYQCPFQHILAGDELAQYRSLKSPNLRFLLKLHGDCRRRRSRVLLSSEYDVTYNRHNLVREEIELLYRLNHLLFLGCSLGPDRTVCLIEEVARSDRGMPDHFCFLALPTDDPTRREREKFLTQRGIFPIWYSLPHEESLIALLDGLISAPFEGVQQ